MLRTSHYPAFPSGVLKVRVAATVTLNITLLTEQVIYQGADLRLTNGDTGKLVTDVSGKIIEVGDFEWSGFVTYTGIGRAFGRDTSDLVVDWLTGVSGSPDVLVQKLADEARGWVTRVARHGGRHLPHTFVLTAFIAGRAQAWVVSNFEDAKGRYNSAPSLEFRISSRRLGRGALAIVTGQKGAVSRLSRQRLERLAAEPSTDPSRIRQRLTEINRAAAASPAARGTVSPGSYVVSLRSDGQGAMQVSADDFVELRHVLAGQPTPKTSELLKQIGLSPGRLVGATSERSGLRVPFEPCKPVVEVGDGSYHLRELQSAGLDSCMAHDVSESGVVLGWGTRPDGVGNPLPWLGTADDEPQLCGFIGQPGGVNDVRSVAATARMKDGHNHAVRWRGSNGTDLGCYKGLSSGGRTIAAEGTVAGYVCVDATDRSHANFRAAVWAEGAGATVLEGSKWDWTQAVAIARDGRVLVVAYTSFTPEAVLWDPEAGSVEWVGGQIGVYPMAIAADGTVLGKGNDRSGEAVAVLARQGGDWTPLGTDSGWYATAMNDAGDVVGATVVEGFERPWLRRSSGEIQWLPFYLHHWCRPSAVNSAGTITGCAQADHGSHALVWTPN
jgi:uncharacterized membrane protein